MSSTPPHAFHLTEEQAQELVDGLLTASDAERLAAHAAACPDCQALVDGYQTLCQALDTLPLPDLPGGFTEGVLARVDADERARAQARRTAAAVVAGTLGALAAVVIAAGVGTWAPAAANAAEQLGHAARALRIGADVLPSVLSAVRWPLALACGAAAAPILYALARLSAPSRTETA